MDIISFNQAIKDFYRTKYNVEYLNDVTITSEIDGEYTTFLCKMPFNQSNRPLNIMGQFKTIEEFLQYVLKELSTNRYPSDVIYFKLIQTDGIDKRPK